MANKYDQLASLVAEGIMAKLAPVLDDLKKDLASLITKNAAISGTQSQHLKSRLALVEDTIAGNGTATPRTGVTKGGNAKKKAAAKKTAAGAAKPSSHLRNGLAYSKHMGGDPDFQAKHGDPDLIAEIRTEFAGQERGSDKEGWMNKKIGQAIWNSSEKTKAAIRGELKEVQDSAVEHKPALPIDSKGEGDDADLPIDDTDGDPPAVGDDEDFLDEVMPDGM